MLRKPEPPRPIEDPLDILVGRCPTCKGVIECVRSLADPPMSRVRRNRDRNDEAGGFGAWNDLWSVECPECVSKGMRVTSSDGVAQLPGGPRVYMTKKGD